MVTWVLSLGAILAHGGDAIGRPANAFEADAAAAAASAAILATSSGDCIVAAGVCCAARDFFFFPSEKLIRTPAPSCLFLFFFRCGFDESLPLEPVVLFVVSVAGSGEGVGAPVGIGPEDM